MYKVLLQFLRGLILGPVMCHDSHLPTSNTSADAAKKSIWLREREKRTAVCLTGQYLHSLGSDGLGRKRTPTKECGVNLAMEKEWHNR